MIVSDIRTFHPYLCGQKFTLFTDHNPLKHLLGPNIGIPVLATLKLQRGAIFLSGYEFEIKYPTSKQNANVDLFIKNAKKCCQSFCNRVW